MTPLRSSGGRIAKDDPDAEKDDIKEYVFLYVNEMAVLKEVNTGIQDNTYIQVVSGIEEGDEVITAPYRAVSKTLKNRDAVEKVDKEDLFKGDE